VGVDFNSGQDNSLIGNYFAGTATNPVIFEFGKDVGNVVMANYNFNNVYFGRSVGIGTTSPSSKLDVAGDVEIGNTNYFYLGDPSTDGSWRFHVTSNNLRFERRISGSWVDKGGFNG
jgi:hypothetical protein